MWYRKNRVSSFDVLQRKKNYQFYLYDKYLSSEKIHNIIEKKKKKLELTIKY